jgi:xanthine/CO dehydrogenase XdhC/CoxF family maturation factor
MGGVGSETRTAGEIGSVGGSRRAAAYSSAMSLLADLATRDRWRAEGKSVVAATVISVEGTAPRPPGSRMLVAGDGEVAGSVSGGCVESDVIVQAEHVAQSGEPRVLTYGITDEEAFEVGLACGGTIRVLVERW